jgi:hypothetical protein
MKAVVHEGHALGGRQAPGVWKRRCAQENLTATGRADAPIRTRKPATGATKTINLALQGGGTHEAFTWARSTGCSMRGLRLRGYPRPAPAQ